MPPASPSTARAINDRLALRLLQQEGPLTAGQLKQLTGLSRPTVADLVERLTAAGLIAVVGESGEQRRGPNARLYGIVADRAQLAALDVRTESVTVVVCDLLGTELTRASVPIADGTGTGLAVDRAVALVERAAKEAGADRLHTVGIGAPGLIDPSTGRLRDSATLPAWHRRLVAALGERLPARVIVENETNLAALAEQRDGAVRDRDTFVLLWLGRGTGAAVVLDGRLRRGASGGTGEIGFLPVPGTGTLPSATDCAGGFHALVADEAVTRLAEAHGLTPRRTATEPYGATLVGEAVREVAGRGADGRQGDGGGVDDGPRADDGPAAGDGPGADGGRRTGRRRAGHAGGAGDTAASRFLDALADRIVIGAASVVAVLDPGCVVLGGEIGQAGGAVLAARVQERLIRLSPLLTEVRASELGGDAVVRGALLTARDAAQDELFGSPPGR